MNFSLKQLPVELVAVAFCMHELILEPQFWPFRTKSVVAQAHKRAGEYNKAQQNNKL
jgi:hypothetical protein